MNASDEVKEDWNTFLLSSNKAEFSRKLIPYLLEAGSDRNFLLGKFKSLANQKSIFDLDFTSDEFDLLEPEKYEPIFADALTRKKYELVYSIGKATGRYGICCRFPTGTPPKDILEELNNNLLGKLMVTCYIPKADIDEMLHYGLIPYPEVVNVDPKYVTILELYREGFIPSEIAYWKLVEDPVAYLSKVGLWSLVTREYVLNECKLGNSYCASLIFEDLLYKSIRPKTNMDTFRTSVSCTYSSLEEIPDKKIAVTRYSLGMSKGLFYGERPKNICGLFYYHEPESETYLSYRRSFTAFNKTHAAMKLLKKKEDENLSRKLRQLSFNENTPKKEMTMKHIKGVLPADLRFTAETAEDLLVFEGGNEEEHGHKKVYMGNRKKDSLVSTSLNAERIP
jgi:hypothetical protein